MSRTMPVRFLAPKGFTRLMLRVSNATRNLSEALAALTKERGLMVASNAEGITLLVPRDLMEELPAILASFGQLAVDPLPPEEMLVDELITEIFILQRAQNPDDSPGNMHIDISDDREHVTVSQDAQTEHDLTAGLSVQDALANHLKALQQRQAAEVAW